MGQTLSAQKTFSGFGHRSVGHRNRAGANRQLMERSSDRSVLGGCNCEGGQTACRSADLRSAAVSKEPDAMNVRAFWLGWLAAGCKSALRTAGRSTHSDRSRKASQADPVSSVGDHARLGRLGPRPRGPKRAPDTVHRLVAVVALAFGARARRITAEAAVVPMGSSVSSRHRRSTETRDCSIGIDYAFLSK